MPPRPALINSVVCTGLALIVFGAVKGRLTGISMLKSRFQTALVAGLPPAQRSISRICLGDGSVSSPDAMLPVL